MTVTERKPGVGCGKLLMGGYHCGRPGEGLCSRCWAIQHDEDAASLRQQLEGAVGAIGDAIQLLQGYGDGDAVDARALLKAAHAKFGVSAPANSPQTRGKAEP